MAVAAYTEQALSPLTLKAITIMKPILYPIWALAAVATLFALLLPPAARAAALGDHVVAASQGTFVAKSVQPGAVAVKTYVNTAGVVFAISWHGPVKPDLQALLGQYFPAATAHPSLGGVSVVQSGDLVVYSSGFMRNFSGYAYLKSQTPAGFKFNQ